MQIAQILRFRMQPFNIMYIFQVQEVIKVVEKELGFGEGQLLHKLCKVSYSLIPVYIRYNSINAICFVLRKKEHLCCIGVSVCIWREDSGVSSCRTDKSSTQSYSKLCIGKPKQFAGQ